MLRPRRAGPARQKATAQRTSDAPSSPRGHRTRESAAREMDAPRALWYFSTMPRAPRPSPVRTVAFHRAKYGRELLVDAGFLRRLPNFDFSGRPQSLAF